MRKGMLAAAAAFAASPRGRRMIQQATSYLRSPQGQRKIAELRARAAQRTAARSAVRQP
jgi:CHASE3 domain sensor protein